jgi:thiamine-phosphate pyrophosphorylase
VIVCLITDRRRLRSPFGGDDTTRLVCQVESAALAGVDLIQVRERDLDGGPLVELVSRCLDAIRGSSTTLVVNERADVALACGAHGVHLRGNSLGAARIRAIAPPTFTIGRSVHDAGEGAREAAGGGLDYLLLGSVFPTSSKPSAPAWLGAAPLTDLVRQVSMPVLAVGGVDLSRLPAIAQGGASGFGAIGLFADVSGPHELAEIVRRARKTFDMLPARP